MKSKEVNCQETENIRRKLMDRNESIDEFELISVTGLYNNKCYISVLGTLIVMLIL